MVLLLPTAVIKPFFFCEKIINQKTNLKTNNMIQSQKP